MSEILTRHRLHKLSRSTIITLATAIALSASPAHGDSIYGQACPPAQSHDPAFPNLSAEGMVDRPEVIVEGVIESCQAEDFGSAWAMMRIDRVWKGDVTSHVILLFGSGSRSTEWWPSQSGPLDCPAAVQVGERVRLGADVLGQDFLQFGRIALDGDTDIIGWPGFASRAAIHMPLHDPDLDPLLAAYAVKTGKLQQAAATGGRQANLAFEEHLLANNETYRAFEIYDALLRENPNDLDLLLILAV